MPGEIRADFRARKKNDEYILKYKCNEITHRKCNNMSDLKFTIKKAIMMTAMVGTIVASPITSVYATSINTGVDTSDVVPKTFEELTGKPLTKELSEEGDAPTATITNQGVQLVDGNTGSITVKANISKKIHEQAFVTLTEVNTGEEYTAFLYEVNGYETVLNVPTGIYITGGGLTADAAGRFRMSEVYFNAAPYTNTPVIVDLIDHQEELNATKEKEELNKKTVSHNDSVDFDKEEENDKKSLLSIVDVDGDDTYHVNKNDAKDALLSLIITLVVAGVAYFGYKKYKEKHKEDDE